MGTVQSKLVDRSSEDDATDDAGQCVERHNQETISLEYFHHYVHESELCHTGEAGLCVNKALCQKHLDHSQYISPSKFTITDLPDRYRSDLMMNVIQSLCDLTVRVTVSFTSPLRPDCDSNTGDPYPFQEIKGSKLMRTGSGKVDCVHMLNDSEKSCVCKICRVSGSPSTVWGEVWIYTATHLVYDDSEAKSTKCRLFYDDSSSDYVDIDGWELVLEADIDEDRSWLACATCDVNLLTKLNEAVTRWNKLSKEAWDTHWWSKDVDRLTVIVSHPHGCPKQISIGEWTRRLKVWDYDTKYFYTACTCPGSSGAFVYMLGRDVLYSHVHSGTNSLGNCSGKGWF